VLGVDDKHLVDGAGPPVDLPGPGAFPGKTLAEANTSDRGENIARAWIKIARRATPDTRFVECTVDGRPGPVTRQHGVTVTVFAFDIAGDRIRNIWAVRNPEKLRSWAA
jgi:hypothetical protein